MPPSQVLYFGSASELTAVSGCTCRRFRIRVHHRLLRQVLEAGDVG